MLSRRAFVGGSAAGLGFVFAGAGSLAAFARPAAADPHSDRLRSAGPGPQRHPRPAEGFSYKLVARSGVTPTADGVHPSDPDGMGVFGGARRLRAGQQPRELRQ